MYAELPLSLGAAKAFSLGKTYGGGAVSGALKDGDILLLENVRYYNEEEANDPAFAEKLAKVAELYVNDAFGAAHRAHASVEAVTHFAPICVGGFLMRDEVHYFHRAMEDPARPLVAIIGGAKISSKLSALHNLLKHVDKLIVGGAMANTFLFAQGREVGTSLCERDMAEICVARFSSSLSPVEDMSWR